MKKIIALLLSVALISGISTIPGGTSNAQGDSLEEFQLRSNGKLKVVQNKENQGIPAFVSGILSEKQEKSDGRNAIKFFEKHREFFKMTNPTSNLVEVSTKQDQMGTTHVKLQQTKNGLPVDRNTINVRFDKNNVITAVNGNFDTEIDAMEFDTTPVLNELDAVDAAKSAIDAPSFIDFIGIDLIVYPHNGDYYLAYRVNLEFMSGEGGNWFIYIDALSGEVIDKFNAQTGLGFFSDILPTTTSVESTVGESTAPRGPNRRAILNTASLKPATGIGIGVKGDQKHLNISHANTPGKQLKEEAMESNITFGSIFNQVANRVEFKQDNRVKAVEYKIDAAGAYTLNIKQVGGDIIQTHTIADAPAESWIQFNIEPIEVKAGDTFEFEIIKPAHSATFAATGFYDGDYWKSTSGFFTFIGWGFPYTHAMGFVFEGYVVDAGSKFYLADNNIPNMGGIYTYNLKNTTGVVMDLYENDSVVWKDVVYSGDSTSWLTVGQGPGIDAHANSRIVYDYFLNNHGRNSLDDKGMAIISRVHFGQKYNSAFWSNGLSMMTYGDGDGSFHIPLTAIDVTAHEITHGITYYNGGLRYLFETGAINEAFSDTFASIIDNDDWENGEEIMGDDQIALGRTAFRSSEEPGKFKVRNEFWAYSIDGEGRYPAHMNEYYYLPDSMDNGGVHINSTILQHSAYLVAEKYGMGRKVVADTWYRAYDYLHYDATIAEFREAILQSATDLYGVDSSQYNAFLNAFDDIGLYEGWSMGDNPRGPVQ